MALLNTLLSLKKCNQITRFDMINDEKAVAHFPNGKTLILYMPTDYIIGPSAILQSIRELPRPDYFLYNNWSKLVDGTYEEADRQKIQLVKYGRFRYILEENYG